MQVMECNWVFLCYGTKKYKLKHLLNGLKSPLSALNQANFSNIYSREVAAKLELESFQRSMLHSSMMSDHYKAVRKSRKLLLEAERLFIAQKAKSKYLKEGDRCIKFFHDLIKRNNKRNTIMAIQNLDRTICSDISDIYTLFVEHFKSSLGSKVDRQPVDIDTLSSGLIISVSDWAGLTTSVDIEEIRHALFAIDNDKAPDSDGFGSLFFKSTWTIIGSDVYDAVQELFSN